MGRLDGKIALVTGGGSGLGKSAAIHMAEEGASIIVSDINLETATETAETINKERWILFSNRLKSLIRERMNLKRSYIIFLLNDEITTQSQVTLACINEETWKPIGIPDKLINKIITFEKDT